MVNDADEAWNLSIDLKNLPEATRLYRYAVSSADRNRADLRIESDRNIDLSVGKAIFTDRAAPLSLTIYTTYKLRHAEPGITIERSQVQQMQHSSLRNAPFHWNAGYWQVMQGVSRLP